MNENQMNDVIGAVRRRMMQRVAQFGPTPLVALSGGVDSASILFAALAAGASPTCFTFRLDGFQSPDLLAAQNICRHFNIPLQVITIPSDTNSILRDIKEAGQLVKTVKKTIIQCVIPWLHICRAVSSPVILTGLGADDLYCNQRKVAVALHQKGEEAIAKYRHTYTADDSFSNRNIILVAASLGKQVEDIYHDEELNRLFGSVPALDLNRPFEKHISIRAFGEYFSQGKFRRPRLSYQVASGIRARHDALLSDPDVNRRGRRAIIGLYRDIIERRNS